MTQCKSAQEHLVTTTVQWPKSSMRLYLRWPLNMDTMKSNCRIVRRLHSITECFQTSPWILVS
jgi:hypothetical protein